MKKKASPRTPINKMTEHKHIDFVLVKNFWDEIERKNRKKLLLLGVLIVLLGSVAVVFAQYIHRPEPLPELLPVNLNLNYPPHYLFSIYGVNQPLGIALSNDGNRIYVTGSSEENGVAVFDRDGNLLDFFYVPFLAPGETAPVYIDVGPNNNLFVTDRLQHAIFVFSSEGKYLEALVSPSLTMSQFVQLHRSEDTVAAEQISFNRFHQAAEYKNSSGQTVQLPLGDLLSWAPLGIHFTKDGTLLITDIPDEEHSIIKITLPKNWQPGINSEIFEPLIYQFGEFGSETNQFMFPNAVVEDSTGNLYISDGNNSRVTIFDSKGIFLGLIGYGSGDENIGLPRGAAIDDHDRLFIVDAVNQNIKVFKLSGDEPEFLYCFGESGMDDGQFFYPNDIAIDQTGRLYITDRENNRIQVWSY